MTLALIGAASACFMAGVAWIVQLVVYPAFALVGEDGWAAYHDAHRLRITLVVGPAMLVELASSGWLAVAPPGDVSPGWAAAGVALAALTWALTFWVSVPDHERLARRRDLAVAARLTRRHGWRTAAWSAHAVVACLLVAQV